MITFFILSLFSLTALASDSVICENPYSICETLPQDEFETVKTELLLNEEVITKSNKEHAKFLAKIEERILSKFGKTNSELKDLIEKIKISLTKQTASDFSPKIAKLSAKKLASVHFRDAQSLLENPRMAKVFSEYCGKEGLEKNALYDPRDHSLTLCPGFLLDTLLKGSGELDNLGLVIAHELGHILHAPEFTNQLKTPTHFDHLIDCLTKSYIDDKDQKFGSNKESLNQLEKTGVPALKSEIEKVSLDKNYLSALKEALASSTNQIQYFKFYSTLKDQRLTIKQELIADYESAVHVRDQLLFVPEASRMKRMKQLALSLCPNLTPNEKKAYDLKWSGINPGSHPPVKFRIENYFRNPEIRSLIGCPPLKASEKPWCPISD